MTWYLLRRHRTQLATVLTLVALAAVVITLAGNATVAMKTGDVVSFGWYEKVFPLVNGALAAIPVLAGAFAGAPLFAREREQGTLVLALTQSVPRNRWLAGKLLVLAPVLLAAAAVQVLYLWWAATLSPVEPREFTFDSRVFLDASGPVLLASTLFALALGAFLGLVLGSTLTSVITTFAVVLGLTVADRTFLRSLEGRVEGWGGGRWETVWPSPWLEAAVLTAAAAALVASMSWWLRSRLVCR